MLGFAHVDRLFERSQADPERAQKVLLWARELREAIHEVFRAILDKRPVPPMALARLNGAVQNAAEHMRLVPVKGGFAWRFDDLNAI